MSEQSLTLNLQAVVSDSVKRARSEMASLFGALQREQERFNLMVESATFTPDLRGLDDLNARIQKNQTVLELLDVAYKKKAITLTEYIQIQKDLDRETSLLSKTFQRLSTEVEQPLDIRGLENAKLRISAVQEELGLLQLKYRALAINSDEYATATKKLTSELSQLQKLVNTVDAENLQGLNAPIEIRGVENLKSRISDIRDELAGLDSQFRNSEVNTDNYLSVTKNLNKELSELSKALDTVDDGYKTSGKSLEDAIRQQERFGLTLVANKEQAEAFRNALSSAGGTQASFNLEPPASALDFKSRIDANRDAFEALALSAQEAQDEVASLNDTFVPQTYQEAEQFLNDLKATLTGVEESARSGAQGWQVYTQFASDLRKEIASLERQLKPLQQEIVATSNTKLFDENIRGIQAIKAQYKELQVTIEQYVRAVNDGTISTEEYAKTVNQLKARQSELARVVKDVGNPYAIQFRSARELSSEVKRLKDLQKQLRAEAKAGNIEYTEAIEKVNQISDALEEAAQQARNLTNEGDRAFARPAREAQAGADRGRITGRRGARGTLGQVGTFIRDLPALPVPGTNFTTEVVARTLQGLDQLGVGVGTLGAVAIGAGVAIFLFRDQISAFVETTRIQTAVIQGIIEGQKELNRLIVTSTTEEAKERLKLAEQDLEIAKRNFEVAQKNKQDQEALLAKENPVTAFIAQFVPQFAVVNEEFQRSREEFIKQSEVVKKLREGLDANAFSAKDAEEAQRLLAEAQSKAALSASQLAGVLEQTFIEASRFGLDALESARSQLSVLLGGQATGAGESAVKNRLQALADEERIIQAQIKSLQASGIASEEVTQRLSELREELNRVGLQTNIVKEALPQALARDAETRAVQEQIKAIQEQQRLADEAQRDLDDKRKRIIDVFKKFGEGLLKARQDLSDKFEDIARAIATRLGEALEDAFIQATRDREDAIAEGSFLQLEQINTTLKRAREDARLDAVRDAKNQRDEAQINYNRQLRDLRIQKDRELMVIRQGNQAIVEAWRSLFPQLVAEMNRELSRVGGGASGTSSGSSTVRSGGFAGFTERTISFAQIIGLGGV